MTHRVGIGYDIHRLEPGRGIVVGGVQIPCEYRVVAHSDGDVVLHALCDALLGAVGAGDLGEHFPDTDEAHRGRDSRTFVYEVLQLPALKPWRLTNMDCNIIAQVPRMGPYKMQMRQVLAEMLCLPLGRVGMKARTNEGLDAVGEKKAIQAQVVVLLEPIR
jgi:2-C-methyl-D-erythritol 2,4-cyclodiphosphate synthase